MVTAVVKKLTETLKFSIKNELEERNDCRCGVGYVIMLNQLSFHSNEAIKLVMCSISTNGERASLANLKLTIGSLLEYS